MKPAGASKPMRVRGVVRSTMPSSTSSLPSAMMPCPHMSL